VRRRALYQAGTDAPSCQMCRAQDGTMPAAEEIDHSGPGCEQRLRELTPAQRWFNPLFYGLSFGWGRWHGMIRRPGQPGLLSPRSEQTGRTAPGLIIWVQLSGRRNIKSPGRFGAVCVSDEIEAGARRWKPAQNLSGTGESRQRRYSSNVMPSDLQDVARGSELAGV